MAWVAVVFYDLPCFFKATCVLDTFHGGELAADNVLHHPLEGYAISSRAAAEPGSDAAREDAFNGAPVGESLGRYAKLLESPQKV